MGFTVGDFIGSPFRGPEMQARDSAEADEHSMTAQTCPGERAANDATS